LHPRLPVRRGKAIGSTRPGADSLSMAVVHPGAGDELGVLRRTTRRLVYHPLRGRPTALPRLRAPLEPELEHVPGAAAEATCRLSERTPRHEVDAAQGS